MSSNPKADDPIWWALFCSLADSQRSQEMCEKTTDDVIDRLGDKGYHIVKMKRRKSQDLPS